MIDTIDLAKKMNEIILWLSCPQSTWMGKPPHLCFLLSLDLIQRQYEKQHSILTYPQHRRTRSEPFPSLTVSAESRYPSPQPIRPLILTPGGVMSCPHSLCNTFPGFKLFSKKKKHILYWLLTTLTKKKLPTAVSSEGLSLVLKINGSYLETFQLACLIRHWTHSHMDWTASVRTQALGRLDEMTAVCPSHVFSPNNHRWPHEVSK